VASASLRRRFQLQETTWPNRLSRIYAEFYRDLGLPELGYLFRCNRDFAMVEGFSSNLKLQRTQTIMEGGTHCDFRFTRKSGS